MFEELNQRRQAVAENIEKSFIDSDIEKARVGQYTDNAENRRLMRVGQNYGQANGGNRKGDVVEVVANGRKISGKYYGPGRTYDNKSAHTIHLGGNSYFVVSTENSTFKNLSEEKRISEKERKKKETIQKKRVKRSDEIETTILSLERKIQAIFDDPEVQEETDIETGRIPKEYQQLVDKWQKRIDVLQKELDIIKPPRVFSSYEEYMKGNKIKNV